MKEGQFKDAIFHIGFFKSASTFLQKEIFPNVPGYEFVNYAPEDIAIARSVFPEHFSQLYAYEDKKALSYFKDLSGKLIFSCEGFSDKIEHPDHYRITPDWDKPEIVTSNLLKLLSEGGKVLIVLRRQDDLVGSYYKRISEYFLGEEEIFIDFPFELKHPVSKRIRRFSGSGMLYLKSFDYWNFTSVIANAIGKDRLHILLYEDLVNNPEKFFKDLSNIFGEDLTHLVNQSDVRVNKGPEDLKFLTPAAARLCRTCPSLYKFRSAFPRFMWENSGEPLSQKFCDDLMNVYAEGNQKLDAVFDLGLKQYGYY